MNQLVMDAAYDDKGSLAVDGDTVKALYLKALGGCSAYATYCANGWNAVQAQLDAANAKIAVAEAATRAANAECKRVSQAFATANSAITTELKPQLAAVKQEITRSAQMVARLEREKAAAASLHVTELAKRDQRIAQLTFKTTPAVPMPTIRPAPTLPSSPPSSLLAYPPTKNGNRVMLPAAAYGDIPHYRACLQMIGCSIPTSDKDVESQFNLHFASGRIGIE